MVQVVNHVMQVSMLRTINTAPIAQRDTTLQPRQLVIAQLAMRAPTQIRRGKQAHAQNAMRVFILLLISAQIAAAA